MKCTECGATMKVRKESYRYDESGLKHVTLVGVEVARCPRPMFIGNRICNILLLKYFIKNLYLKLIVRNFFENNFISIFEKQFEHLK